METIHGNLYDFPKYYDLVYGSDWRAEVKFLQACFDRYVQGKTRTLFEPACGTGRLMHRLAREGYAVSGLDLNEKAVDFCNVRLQKYGRKPTAFVGDMTDFRLKKPVDAAFNTINSFRHLQTQEQAVAHLACMANAVRKGGVYVLGLHLTPTVGAPLDDESWSARRGHLAVLSRMWVVERNRRQRAERIGMSFDVYTPTRQFRINDQTTFRMYTASQMAELLAGERRFEIAAVHDFAYDIDVDVEINARTEDVIYVLRRR